MKQELRGLFTDSLHLFVFTSFAVAQPIYDLLSKYVDFFVAHNANAADIIILVVTLSVIIPLAFAVIEIVVGFISHNLRRFTHFIFTTMFLTIFALQLFKKSGIFSDRVIILSSAALGVVIALVYMRKKLLRDFFSILGPAVVIFPALFIVFSPVNKIVFPKEVKAVSTEGMKGDKPPIIFLMFDEFPLVSLLDEEHHIDPVRYPNIAALAQEAYWFRNYTVNAPSTTFSIPTVLSGKYIDDYRLMIAEDHPETLFTLLGDTYSIKAVESIGALVPRGMNEIKSSEGGVKERAVAELLDVAVVFLHVLLPDGYSKSLPTITQNWGGFVKVRKGRKSKRVLEKNGKNNARDRLLELKNFISLIEPSEKPSLYFNHIILPHVPWEYLPSGERYNLRITPGLSDELWGNKEMLVLQGYQRHLLQIGAIDKVIGDMVARLKSRNLFDESLIIITADHGCVFKPNQLRREAPDFFESGIIPVPFILKLPHQTIGITSDDNVEAIDVLPTIADILKVQVPWKVDGSSMVEKSITRRQEKVLITNNNRKGSVAKRIYFPPSSIAKYELLKDKLSYFGSGKTKPDGLFSFGPHRDLIGRKVVDFLVKENSPYKVQMEQNSYALNSSSSGGTSLVPSHVSGRVSNTHHSIAEDLDLIIAVNGIIKSTTRSYEASKSGYKNFYSILSEGSFSPGENKVEVFVISTNDGQIQLEGTKSSTCSIVDENTLAMDNTKVPIIPKEIRGCVDAVIQTESHLLIRGWAADVEKSKLVDYVIAFVDGEFISMTSTNSPRPGVPKRYKNDLLLKSGYSLMIPLEQLQGMKEIRIIAVSGAIASELSYKGKNNYFRKLSDMNRKDPPG